MISPDCCPVCGYVFCPLETVCPRCALAPPYADASSPPAAVSGSSPTTAILLGSTDPDAGPVVWRPGLLAGLVGLFVALLFVGAWTMGSLRGAGGGASAPRAASGPPAGPQTRSSYSGGAGTPVAGQPGQLRSASPPALGPDRSGAPVYGSPGTLPTPGGENPGTAGGPAGNGAPGGSGVTLPHYDTPTPVQGSARIGDVHLSVINDGEGHERCFGRVLIVNNGPYAITDFTLGVDVMGTTYVLAPFEGSISAPMPIYYRHIPAGGTLDVPVMTTGYYPSYSASSMKTVDLDAALDGPPGEITDSAHVM